MWGVEDIINDEYRCNVGFGGVRAVLYLSTAEKTRRERRLTKQWCKKERR
jgi:hypothetical protein